MPTYTVLVILCLLLSVKYAESSEDEERAPVYWTRTELGTTGKDRVVLANSFMSQGNQRFVRAVEDENGTESENSTVYEWSCSHPSRTPQGYNESSCKFVRDYCGGQTHLINYLEFIMCDLENVKPIGYIMLAIWCIYVISLLATTVDNFFVPPLIFLAEKLKLSPSIAGITLLALGNGAPDIFCVYSGLGQGDLALVLGSLAGAAMFITSVILSTVILVTKKGSSNVDKIDFTRDIIALMVVISAVILVAFDGVVYILEACIFPLLYIGYIAILILLSCIRSQWKKRSAKTDLNVEEEKMLEDDQKSVSFSLERSLPLRMISKSTEVQEKVTSESKPLSDTKAPQRVELPGLTWPAGNHIIVKIIWAIQWPFSLLRWLTIPPFCPPDIAWTKWHYLFAVISPMHMVLLTLIAAKGWSGFLIMVGVVPLPVILLLVGFAISVLMAILLRPSKPPHWAMMMVLVPLAFIMSIIWLHILANEVISVLTSLGLLLSIDTAILGLTVLALGNCMADWVADTVVARSGNIQMAFASCFGSPMLSHVLGLSVAFMVQILLTNHGAPYVFDLNIPQYNVVKLAWIFIGVSLIGSTIAFPIFKYSPPKFYAVVLICVYVLFVVLAVLCEIGIIPFLW